MNKEDYEKYHKTGGEYVIPIEIFNEIFEEIKRLNNIINELEKYLNEQIEKSWEIEEQCYENIESKLQELNGSDKYPKEE